MSTPLISNVDLLRPVRRPGSQMSRTDVPLYRTLSARELFPVLNARRLAERPVVGERKVPDGTYKSVKSEFRKEPIFGKSEFRNVIDEDGKHV